MKPGSLMDAIVEISHERGLDQDSVISALEEAILTAAKRKYRQYISLEASLNRKNGDIELMYTREVVDEVYDSENEISLEDIQQIDPEAEIGDEVEYIIDSKDFVDVIAQTARQLLFQKIREIERETILKKFSDKKGEIVHGTVARIERGKVILMLNNNAEALLDKREQIVFEKLQPGEHVRALLLDILGDTKGPQLIVSRTHPAFLMKLFEAEIPEVYDGVIDVLAAAREPGKRAKVAVRSNDSDVDPVGSCVGPRGSRVQVIVNELCGERIDIVEWSEDLPTYIARSLSPAEVVSMDIDEEEMSADVEVETSQLSLAIGKQGQNVRLASQLTGYKINVTPWETKIQDPFEKEPEEVVKESPEDAVEEQPEAGKEENSED